MSYFEDILSDSDDEKNKKEEEEDQVEFIENDEDPDDDSDDDDINPDDKILKFIKSGTSANNNIQDNDNIISNINLNDDDANKYIIDQDISDDEYSSDDEDYYKKVTNTDSFKPDLIASHPECIIQNFDEVSKLTKITTDENNIIIDDFHKTLPFLTKYEKTKVLGIRAKQLSSGALSYVVVPENIIDDYIIAQMELSENKIPFIIRRPIPNGSSEYWRLEDLEVIN